MTYEKAFEKHKMKLEKFDGRYDSLEALNILLEMYEDVFGQEVPTTALMGSFSEMCCVVINAMDNGTPLKPIDINMPGVFFY